MRATNKELWDRFKRLYRKYPAAGFAVDFSRMDLTDEFLTGIEKPMQEAFVAMDQLEEGCIANPDENRMVGHYWLRNPALAPSDAIRAEIESTVARIKEFAAMVHSGKVVGSGGSFLKVLVIGIGGSALGPQFVANALGKPNADKMQLYFFDNTDPDGMDKVLDCIGSDLSRTLCIVISKSGGTKETRNGMLEAEAAYRRSNLDFSRHAVAVTMAGSELDRHSSGWITRFPMWDWVGGRTSQLSAVGLLPAALQGINIDELLIGARECDIATRNQVTVENPAAMLAVSWYFAGKGRGEKCMVVLPYKDRLDLFAKYLQQLVMESLGKELDLDGRLVNQGLTVFGNKGSTDQHSYIQQLRDGVDNFFAVFIEVLKDRADGSIQVEPLTTTGDFLHGFLMGTRKALYDSGRKSVTITIPAVTERTVGTLIALFERAVGLYARLINVNAYHQPGVQAGKVAADAIIAMKKNVLQAINAARSDGLTIEQIAIAIGEPEETELVFKLCEHLAANPDRGISKSEGSDPFLAKYRKS